MKSYMQGLMTGCILVFAMFVLIAQTNLDPKLEAQLKKASSVQAELDSLFRSFSKSSNEISSSGIVNFDENILISINKRFDELDKKIEDNNGILHDIYTDGVPCDN